MENKEIKNIMSIKDLSKYIGVSTSKIYQLVRQHKIPASRIGRQYRFSKEIIDAWLKENLITKKDKSNQLRLFEDK